jgi:hypothetical protein
MKKILASAALCFALASCGGSSSPTSSESSSGPIGTWRMASYVKDSVADTIVITMSSNRALSTTYHWVKWSSDTVFYDEKDTGKGTWDTLGNQLFLVEARTGRIVKNGIVSTMSKNYVDTTQFAISASDLLLISRTVDVNTTYYDTTTFVRL